MGASRSPQSIKVVGRLATPGNTAGACETVASVFGCLVDPIPGGIVPSISYFIHQPSTAKYEYNFLDFVLLFS
jgi:hypothetical protein